jgi:hypothetical protein
MAKQKTSLHKLMDQMDQVESNKESFSKGHVAYKGQFVRVSYTGSSNRRWRLTARMQVRGHVFAKKQINLSEKERAVRVAKFADSLLDDFVNEVMAVLADKAKGASSIQNSDTVLTCPKHNRKLYKSLHTDNQWYCPAKDVNGFNGYCEYEVDS